MRPSFFHFYTTKVHNGQLYANILLAEELPAEIVCSNIETILRFSKANGCAVELYKGKVFIAEISHQKSVVFRHCKLRKLIPMHLVSVTQNAVN